MPSLLETMGAWGSSIFVPANVIDAQAENQRMLEAKAALLNGNSNDVLATATRTGILTDGQAKQALGDMNRSMYLVTDSDRQLGQQIIDITLDSAAKAPATLINYTAENVLAPAAKGINKTVSWLIPWQVWLILGVAAVVLVGVFAYVKGKSPLP